MNAWMNERREGGREGMKAARGCCCCCCSGQAWSQLFDWRVSGWMWTGRDSWIFSILRSLRFPPFFLSFFLFSPFTSSFSPSQLSFLIELYPFLVSCSVAEQGLEKCFTPFKPSAVRLCFYIHEVSGFYRFYNLIFLVFLCWQIGLKISLPPAPRQES